MEFLSIPFVVFFIITFTLYYICPSRRWQHVVLLTGSAVFISYFHWQYLAVAVAVTAFTFWSGRILHRHTDTPRGLLILWGSIAVLVGFWLVARYSSPLFPLGISFYTFQALAYLIEIYWDEDPEDDFWSFALYMLLFMKFLSGPIERGYDLLPQLKEKKRFDYAGVVYGLKLAAWGAFLKLVIADRIGPSLDIVLDSVRTASGPQLLLATLVYPLQLYADFAGYTCMALGLGRMMGFRLQPNFNRPFISESTGDLWRRWHISLSFWVRDYVFTPLNASLRRWKQWGVYAALLITFVVIGVWHGAGWTFALYGLFQGVLVVYETACKKQRDAVRERIGHRTWKLLMIIRTYLFFALSLLFFRIKSIGDVFYTYTHLFDADGFSIKDLRLGLSDYYWIVFGVAVVLMFLIEHLHARKDLIQWSKNLKTPLRWTVYAATVLVIFLFGAFGVENFIYIQF